MELINKIEADKTHTHTHTYALFFSLPILVIYKIIQAYIQSCEIEREPRADKKNAANTLSPVLTFKENARRCDSFRKGEIGREMREA